jgi:biopolymer transport protein ExbD
MKFRRLSRRESLRMNLTPLIDMVFLLLVFFLMTTTFNRQSQLEINLPEATTEQKATQNALIRIMVDRQGQYAVNDSPPLIDNRLTTLVQVLTQMKAQQTTEATVMISADGDAPHQAVIRAMEAAQEVGLFKLTFEAQNSPP